MRKKMKFQVTLIVIAALAAAVFLIPYVYHKLAYESQHAAPVSAPQ